MISIEFLRQFRLGGYAIFDVLVSFLGIYLLAPFLSKIFLKIGLNIPKRSWICLTLPIGILAHLLVGKITPMTKDFLDLHSHYVIKIIILIFLIIAIKNIKILKKVQKKSVKQNYP